MTNNSEEKDEEQKRRLYIIHFDACNHTRIVDEQYVRVLSTELQGSPFTYAKSVRLMSSGALQTSQI